MASSHRIVLPSKRIMRARVSPTEIRVARTMRRKGYLLREIAEILDRDVVTVWRYSADVTHKNWLKDRYLQRPRAGAMAHLLDVI